MKELEITCQIYNNVLDIKKELENIKSNPNQM